MKPEVEKLNKTIILSERSSFAARAEAVEQMWKEKVRALIVDKHADFIETFDQDHQLRVKEEKCKMYFKGETLREFGFKKGSPYEFDHHKKYEDFDYYLRV